MTGILLSYNATIVFSSLALVLLTLLVILFRKFEIEITKWGVAIVFTLFGLLGVQMMDRSLNHFRLDRFDDVYTQGEMYSAEVLSIANSNKSWNRALFRITGLPDKYWNNPIDEKVLFMVNKSIDDIAIGDKLFCYSHIFSIENKNNPGEFDSQNYWQSKGVSKMSFLYPFDYRIYGNNQTFLTRWFNRLDKELSEIFETKIQPQAVGIAKAMILGDRDHLDTETLRSFGNSGAMHVLAVSGLHIGLILYLLIYFFSKFPKWISKYNATILALIIIWLYAFLTGFSPSVFRAVVMFSLLSLAKISGREYNPLNVLAASALVLLFVDRLLIYDLGFQLSYLAMIGILVAYPTMKKLFCFKTKVMRWIWEGTSVALSAQLFTLPLTLYCFHQFPNYFLLSNLGLMVLTNVILVVGVLFIAFYKIPLINVLLAWLLSLVVMSMFYFVQWIDFLPGSVAKGFVLKDLHVVVFYGVLLLVFVAFRMSWRYRTLIAGTSAILVCTLLVFHRFDRIGQDELVIFNDSRILFTIKKDDRLFCFYESDDYLGKVMYLSQTYERTRSGNIEYVLLQEDKEVELKAEGIDFRCRFFPSYYEMDVNGKRLHLTRNWFYRDQKVPRDIDVYMPWVMIENEKAHKLASGAFVYPL